ncbi:MAG: D-tyrosyl-tRNA(Tyr) deacylase [Chloroflexi bacterium HGW-Chloroflexi-3]|nr:MAG: D-tyrosyl-tRNA(Tyr) deacylase [Chloroflexi bacterium HGW-Chloroflexi-3]
MRALIQRISKGSVSVDQRIVAGEVGIGLMIFLGVGHEDNQEKARILAKKIANLRIFGDEDGKMNLSILDLKGHAIVVSQFTLYADTKKGNRPSFIDAANPEKADQLVNYFTDQLRSFGIPTQQGEFAAHMMVSLVNDGPVTIWIEN